MIVEYRGNICGFPIEMCQSDYEIISKIAKREYKENIEDYIHKSIIMLGHEYLKECVIHMAYNIPEAYYLKENDMVWISFHLGGYSRKHCLNLLRYQYELGE